MLSIGGHLVTIETFDLLAMRIVDVEEHTRLLTGLERVLHDLTAVLRDLRILVGSSEWVDSTNTVGRELTLGQSLLVNLVSGIRTQHRQEDCQTHQCDFFHFTISLMVITCKVKHILINLQSITPIFANIFMKGLRPLHNVL